MNFLKRCWQKRWFRRLTWTLTTLVTLYFLFCTWVNWSGARQWRATVAMLQAEGETLDFRATMNEPIPEAENFCAIPLLKDLALAVDGDTTKGAPAEKRKRLEVLKLQSNTKAGARPRLTNATFGRATDLKAWADWLRKEGSLPVPADSGDAAHDVLAALSKHDALVQELAAGLSRPKAQWTPEWKTRELPALLPAIALPHYSVTREQTLALRAVAAARTGDAAKAHESALIIARFSQASLNDPFLIGLLVAASEVASLHGIVWDLCAAHTGSADDFARLESALAVLDFHQGALHAARCEMTAMVDTIHGLKRRPEDLLGLIQFSNDGGSRHRWSGKGLISAVPSGFFDASAAVIADLEFRYVIQPLKEAGWERVFVCGQAMETELATKKQNIWAHPSWILASLALPATRGVMARCAYTNSLVNQAVIACALERHRIEKGAYPDSLDALHLADGKPLPPDPMDGKPMRYRKTPDGRYALWSIGFDGKDDGGKRTLDKKQPEYTRFHDAAYLGDWVWDFPAE